MKRMLCLLGAVFMLTVGVCAAELPKDLTHAVPDGAKELLRGEDFSGTEGFTGGISALTLPINCLKSCIPRSLTLMPSMSTSPSTVS